MRVALFSRNARNADAIGSQMAAKVAYYQQRGAELRLYLAEAGDLHQSITGVKPIEGKAGTIWNDAVEREYLLACDLVVAEFGAAYDLMNLLPALHGQGPRIIIDYRGVTPVELGDVALQPELEAAARQRMLAWCADAVVVQSQFAANELHEATGIPRDRIYQLACWMKEPAADERLLAEKLRARHYLQSKKVLLFVGRMSQNKQPELVIRALASLDQDVHAVFVGCQSDAYQGRLGVCRRLAAETGVQDRVHFLGIASEEELGAWISAADVLVLPSRHECFGMPVVEAMMRGTPVVASNAGSLPEVLGQAGLLCDVEDHCSLASQIRRYLSQSILPSTNHIALVTHRFGTHFAGGAEKSLRLMAQSLQQSGYVVEIFSTCNDHEATWRNTLPAGTMQIDGYTVHRFPIDPFDAEQLGQSYQKICQAEGRVSDEVEQQYLRNSLGSSSLIESLVKRRNEFAAIISGPYLFKLTHEVATRFRDQVLLVPCFHDEPLARLRAFQHAYRSVGGLLFHTEAEAGYSATGLGVTNPRHTVMGTVLEESAFQSSGKHYQDGPYLVYCGRYCPEKGVDRLIGYMEHLATACQGCIKLVCMGQGPMKLPDRPWLLDMGFVDEAKKREIIAGAMGMVNLSKNESLSIVALEAWALGVPVIVDAGCAVLVDQVARSKAGVCISNKQEFVDIVLEWSSDPSKAGRLGANGYEFVRREYADKQRYGKRLHEVVGTLQQSLRDVATRAGKQRANLFESAIWHERYSEILEQVLLRERQEAVTGVRIARLQRSLIIPQGSESGTVTVRLHNTGQRFVASEGPARALLHCTAISRGGDGKKLVTKARLPGPLVPGQEQLVVLAFDAPSLPGNYRLRVRLSEGRRVMAQCGVPIQVSGNKERFDGASGPRMPLGPVVQSARSVLSQAKRLEQLPEEYVDVTEGKLASLKLMLKKKLLNNFRKAYVDVAFRQQSALNEKLITVMSLILETLSVQDMGATLATLKRQVHKLEKQLKKERRWRKRLQRKPKTTCSPDVSLMEGE